jgi:hypothetical protein
MMDNRTPTIDYLGVIRLTVGDRAEVHDVEHLAAGMSDLQAPPSRDQKKQSGKGKRHV